MGVMPEQTTVGTSNHPCPPPANSASLIAMTINLSRSLALVTTLLSLALITPTAYSADTVAKPKTKAKTTARGPMVHMVSFKFKPEAAPEKIREVEQAFAALQQKIQFIQSFEWGTNVSPEKLDKGFTHGFVLTFKDAKDRDAYLVHPDHQAFGKLVGPVLADVFVVDFLGKE
jgi:hypothetical protein